MSGWQFNYIDSLKELEKRSQFLRDKEYEELEKDKKSEKNPKKDSKSFSRLDSYNNWEDDEELIGTDFMRSIQEQIHETMGSSRSDEVLKAFYNRDTAKDAVEDVNGPPDALYENYMKRKTNRMKNIEAAKKSFEEVETNNDAKSQTENPRKKQSVADFIDQSAQKYREKQEKKAKASDLVYNEVQFTDVPSTSNTEHSHRRLKFSKRNNLFYNERNRTFSFLSPKTES